MSILDMKGKRAGEGELVLYHLSDNGKMLYSESVEETDDSFIFDGAKTILIGIVSQGKNQASLQAQKVSESSFGPLKMRVLKSSVTMVTDLNDAKVKEVVVQSLTGLIVPDGGMN